MIGVLQKTKYTNVISVRYYVDERGREECVSNIELFVTELAGNRIMRIVGRVKGTVEGFIRQPQKQSSVVRNRKGRTV